MNLDCVAKDLKYNSQVFDAGRVCHNETLYRAMRRCLRHLILRQ